MLQLEPRDYQILQQILSKYPYKFYAYGSRAKGTARRFSDLDICYLDDIPRPVINNIKEELEESNLSLIVELISWKHMRPNFRKAIKEDLTLIS